MKNLFSLPFFCCIDYYYEEEVILIFNLSTASLVSLERSKSTGEEFFKRGSSTPYSATANRNLEQLGEKQVIRVEKADYKDEGPSNPQYPAISSDRNLAIPKGGRKPTNGRIKKLKKNYFRFMPF